MHSEFHEALHTSLSNAEETTAIATDRLGVGKVDHAKLLLEGEWSRAIDNGGNVQLVSDESADVGGEVYDHDVWFYSLDDTLKHW